MPPPPPSPHLFHADSNLNTFKVSHLLRLISVGLDHPFVVNFWAEEKNKQAGHDAILILVRLNQKLILDELRELSFYC